MTSFRAALMILVLFCILAPSSVKAQASNNYAEASASARSQGKIHLIYFYNAAFHQPRQFADLLEDVRLPEDFIVTNLDVNDDVGRALSEAFYARSQFEGEDELNAVLIIERNTFSRSISILGPDPDQIDKATWYEFFENALG